MKTILLILIHTILTAGSIIAQKQNINSIPLIGQDAPAFIANSTKGIIHFPSDYVGTWKILFSHPADFTPVCTSEILELARMQQEFKKLNVSLIVISTDELVLHKSWERSMNEMIGNIDNSAKIDFPLLDDSNDSISWKYGMISPFVDPKKTVRGVFIIDPQNTIQAIFFYPKYMGRNLEEIKRTVIAMQTSGENAVLTPVNWKPGDDVLLPYPYPYNYYDSITGGSAGYFNLSWYMLYKKMKQ
jgi:peroxiredoxin 2/4